LVKPRREEVRQQTDHVAKAFGGGSTLMHLCDAVELPPQLWTLAESRRFVSELLVRAAVPQTVHDELAVAVTEACSNVVRHAPDGGAYRLTVDINDDRCLIEVQDGGSGLDPNAPANGSPDRDGGRGLVLMRALVDEVRFERRQPGFAVTMIKSLAP
jgi:serine/threonine-protein kinase RsbW